MAIMLSVVEVPCGFFLACLQWQSQTIIMYTIRDEFDVPIWLIFSFDEKPHFKDRSSTCLSNHKYDRAPHFHLRFLQRTAKVDQREHIATSSAISRRRERA
eukprot:832383-Amphidinium_carterae.1